VMFLLWSIYNKYMKVRQNMLSQQFSMNIVKTSIELTKHTQVYATGNNFILKSHLLYLLKYKGIKMLRDKYFRILMFNF